MTAIINTRTQLCAVIGDPVAHSLSPAMHNAAFAAAGLNYAYLAFNVRDLAGAMAGMRALGGFRGMSVTIPHKIAVMAYLDDVDPLARKVGCVNTVVRDGDRLVGTITDGLGTLRAFDRAGITLENKNIVFVGAGGAARAVAFAIAQTCSPGKIRILGRTRQRIQTLVDDLIADGGASVEGGALDADLTAAMAASDIVIQATPVGMHGYCEGDSPIAAELLRPDQVVFDMVYRPMKTRLMLDAEAAGCTLVPGLEMLLHQAILQFELWTGQAAPEAIMRQALVQALEQS